MRSAPLFRKTQYLRKALNTFFPRMLFALSPRKKSERRHWASQESGDRHGYEKYIQYNRRVAILVQEVCQRSNTNEAVLDLGCNCGLYLSYLKKAGYTHLTGIDICRSAIDFGRRELDLVGVDMINGSFEEILPGLERRGDMYDVVYSMGATLELVHPSFDVIQKICAISRRFIILGISEWGHAYPRFWECEFNRNGFLLVKSQRPFDTSSPVTDPSRVDALLVFQRIH